MSVDPAFDMPRINWVQQGSFEQGTIPPVGEPDAGTQVWLGPINQVLVPWVCGCLDQGRNPSAWLTADDAATSDILRRWDTLMGLLCANGGSEMPIMIRYTADCHLQTSSDGGMTWTDVPGWLDNIGFCIRDALPPPPPAIGPGPIQQRACNIAGFLANQSIELAIILAKEKIDTGRTLLQYASDVSNALLATELPYTNDFVQAINILYGLVTEANIADYDFASTDPALVSALTCEIYNAIKNDGQVTDGNYLQIVTNVCGMSYSRPSVVAALCQWFSVIGSQNLRALQNVGALEVIDCTGCGDWCWEWDMTASSGGWATYLSPGGSWSAGNGWVAQYRSSDNTTSINIHINLPSTQVLTRIHIQLKTTVANIHGDFILEMATGGSLSGDCAWDATTDGAIHQYDCGPFAVSCDNLYFAFEAPGNVAAATLLAIVINGHGINPFGADNCTPG